MLLAPAAPAQKLPTPSSSTQDAHGVPQCGLADAASKPAQQEQVGDGLEVVLDPVVRLRRQGSLQLGVSQSGSVLWAEQHSQQR